MARVVELRLVDKGEVVVKTRPYSLRDTLRVYSFGWMYWGGSGGRVGLGEDCVAHVSEAGGGAVSYELYCAERPSFDPVESLERVLGVSEDISGYARLARGDPLVGGVLETMPGYRVRLSSVWAAFLTAVCQQNASFRQGWGMLYRLHLLASPRLRLPDGAVHLETPQPGELNAEVLRRAGLGYRARTVIEASSLAPLDCKNVEELRGVRGVGPYTIALVKILACRDYTLLPLDRWLLKLAARAYKLPEDRRVVEEHLRRRFGEWVGLAALHATIAFDAQPLRRALERLERGLNKPGLDEPSPITLWRITPPPRGE